MADVEETRTETGARTMTPREVAEGIVREWLDANANASYQKLTDTIEAAITRERAESHQAYLETEHMDQLLQRAEAVVEAARGCLPVVFYEGASEVKALRAALTAYDRATTLGTSSSAVVDSKGGVAPAANPDAYQAHFEVMEKRLDTHRAYFKVIEKRLDNIEQKAMTVAVPLPVQQLINVAERIHVNSDEAKELYAACDAVRNYFKEQNKP